MTCWRRASRDCGSSGDNLAQWVFIAKSSYGMQTRDSQRVPTTATRRTTQTRMHRHAGQYTDRIEKPTPREAEATAGREADHAVPTPCEAALRRALVAASEDTVSRSTGRLFVL
jgi:hypothetical protein